jgi:hypothetical protein
MSSPAWNSSAEQRRRTDQRQYCPARWGDPRSRWDHPLCRQPRPKLQQLLFGYLLYAESQVRPPGTRAHRRKVYNFYIDMRTAYKDYDEFYQRVLEEGTLFVRGKVAEVTDAARGQEKKAN